MDRHLILVGMSGSGKSTVGKRVAELLDAAFTDIDQVVADRAGTSIAELFRTEGEARFRDLERAAMEDALAAPPQVISTGGGWIAQPGNLETARRQTRLAGPAQALVICLSVRSELAAARLTGDTSRPLLAGPDPGERIAELLAEREVWYRQADAEVDASGSVDEVAESVAQLARET
jgi:shikimate kinase